MDSCHYAMVALIRFVSAEDRACNYVVHIFLVFIDCVVHIPYTPPPPGVWRVILLGGLHRTISRSLARLGNVGHVAPARSSPFDVFREVQQHHNIVVWCEHRRTYGKRFRRRSSRSPAAHEFYVQLPR